MAVIRVESHFKTNAYSESDYNTMYGLMQLTESSLLRFGVPREKFYDLFYNIRAGVRHLYTDYKRVGSLYRAVSAYNCGVSYVLSNNIPESTKIYTALVFKYYRKYKDRYNFVYISF